VEGPHDLGRFVGAQDEGGTYSRALLELQHGRKRSHWMWFVFPQLVGLGSSPTAQRYAIHSLEEARAYVEHPVPGPRLRDCAQALLDQPSVDADLVMGAVDALKLHSSMTLFGLAAPREPCFPAVLARFFGGAGDARTEELLGHPLDCSLARLSLPASTPRRA
jgi:uncharacterized protein (DUF1810 family)